MLDFVYGFLANEVKTILVRKVFKSYIFKGSYTEVVPVLVLVENTEHGSANRYVKRCKYEKRYAYIFSFVQVRIGPSPLSTATSTSTTPFSSKFFYILPKTDVAAEGIYSLNTWTTTSTSTCNGYIFSLKA